MKKLTGLLFAMFTTFVITTAHAETVYTAVAIGEKPTQGNTPWSTAVASSQKKANSKALKLCNAKASDKSCKLLNPVAFARASGKTRLGISLSQESKDDAVSLALKKCNSADCKLDWVKTEPGFLFIFMAKRQNGDTDFFMQHGGANVDETMTQGEENCKKNNQVECTLAYFGAVPGPVEIDSKQDINANSSPISERNCRPNTPTIRCSSQCTNGNCVVTYENGCKMHVQVAPTVDPFSGMMTFPTPQC